MIRFYVLFFLFLTLSFPLNARADNVFLDKRAFEQIPVLHEGRVKPVLSMARGYLIRFSGRDTVQDLDSYTAQAWLAELLFTPEQAMFRPVFRVSLPTLREVLGLERSSGHLYHYHELQQAFRTQSDFLNQTLALDSNQWSNVQKDLIDLHENMIVFNQLMNSFSLLRPLNLSSEMIDVLPPYAQDWARAKGNYLQSLIFAERLRQQATRLAEKTTKAGTDLATLSASDQAVLSLAFMLEEMRLHGALNIVFRVVPSSYSRMAQETGQSEFFAPWALYEQGASGPETAPIIAEWAQILQAYQNSDTEKWQQSLAKIRDYSIHTNSDLMRPYALGLEWGYHHVKPMELSFLFCLLGFLSLLIFFISGRGDWRRVAWISLSCAVLVHGAALLARVIILYRPPISTLYESIIFVAWVAMAFGLLLAWLTNRQTQRADFAVFAALLSGVILNLVAFTHTAHGETMIVLAAVLNSGFWLATHVIIITIGYALCLFAAVLAHVQLYQFPHPAARKTIGLDHMVLNTTRLALLFVIVGTILGGIWADQSWGRFWGWDPKENGALLIALWLVWLLHARMTNFFADYHIMAGLAALNIIVALSWFGTNLLGVGLHSYGFSDKTLWSLIATTVIEIFLIGGLLWRIQRHKRLII